MLTFLLGVASSVACTYVDMPLIYDGDRVATDHGLWFDREPLTLEVRRVSDDAVVPVTVHRFGVSWVALPDAGWEPGEEHEIWLDAWDVGSFEAGFEPTPEPGLALPARRMAWTETELVVGTTMCGYDTPGTFTWSGVWYRGCLHDAFMVVVVSEEQPPDPALDDGGDWVVGGDSWGDDDHDGGWSPTGEAVTLWFGAVDARGRFGGWTRDDLPLPEPGSERRDTRPDATYGPDSTPTSFTTCPVAAWELGEPVFPDAGPDAAEADGCGCDTAPRSPGLLPLVVLAAVARRRAARRGRG